jgi:hypothetical protein
VTFQFKTDPQLQRLIERHPAIFRGRAPGVPSYVTPGWFNLIDKLCIDIEAELGVDGCSAFEVMQIKEKFGTLRFYYRIGESEDLHVDVMSPDGLQHFVARTSLEGADGLKEQEARVRQLVAAACVASETTCETCGAPAQLRDVRGWLTTLCDKHHEGKLSGDAS